MTLLTSLSANYGTCISPESVSVDFPSYFVIFSFFACLVIFDWKPYIVKFTFPGTGYFYISKNILELSVGCSRVMWKQVASFWSFFQDLLDRTRIAFTLRLIILYYWVKILWIYPCSMNCMIFLVWFIETGTIPSQVWALGTVCSDPLRLFLFQHQVVSSHVYFNQYLTEYMREVIWSFPDVFLLVLILQTPTTLVSLDSQLCILNTRSPLTSIWLASPCAITWCLFQESNLI